MYLRKKPVKTVEFGYLQWESFHLQKLTMKVSKHRLIKFSCPSWLRFADKRKGLAPTGLGF